MTSPFNTICYPPDQKAASCPITDIKFKKRVEQVDQGYSRINIPRVGAFLYTKTAADSRPITAMQILKVTEGIPCADPGLSPPGCNVKDMRYSRI